MKYLLFDNEADAIERSDEGGAEKGLAYHEGDPNGTRYMWPWCIEDGGALRAALLLDEFDGATIGIDLLTPAEVAALVTSLPSGWVFPPAPFPT